MLKKIVVIGAIFTGITTTLLADPYANTLNTTASSAITGWDYSKFDTLANADSPAVIILTGMTTPDILSQVQEYVNGEKPLDELEITKENHAQFLAAAKILDLTIPSANQQNSTYQVRYTALLKSDGTSGNPHFNTAINAFSTPPADEQDPLLINELDNQHPSLQQMDAKTVADYRVKMNLYSQKKANLHPEFSAIVKKVAEIFGQNIANLQTMLNPPRAIIYIGTSGTGKSTMMKKNMPDLNLDTYIASTDNFIAALCSEFNKKFSESQFFYLSVCLRREFESAIKEKYAAPAFIQELWLANETEIANVFRNSLPIEVNDFDGDLRLISLRTILRARSPGGRPTLPWDQMVRSYRLSRQCRPLVFAAVQAKDTYHLQYSYNDGTFKIYSLEEARNLFQIQSNESIDNEIACVAESLITTDDVAIIGDAIREFEGKKISDAFELAKFPFKQELPGQNPARRFTILFTGDTHSHLENTQKIAHRILVEKQDPENGDILVADVGDMLTGTEYFEVSKGALEIEMMNLAGYDIATIGNHEFDLGWPHLEKILEGVDFDLVCANVFDVEKNAHIAQPYKIIPLGSLNVAFVGIMGRDAWNSIRPTAKLGLNLLDPDDVLDELLPQLEIAADVIVLLSHSGVVADRQFAAKHVQLDAILGGHSHTYMAEPELIQVLGDNKRIPVFHSSKHGDYLGKLTFDVINKEKRHFTQLIKMDSSQEPQGNLSSAEEQIKNKLHSVIEKIEEIYSTVIAVCIMPLPKEEIKKNVGPLGRDFICHILKECTQADVAVYPTGGIRTGLEIGPITLRTIVNLLPSDRLVTYTVRGAWLRQLMDDGEKRWIGQMRTFQSNGIEINQATHEITVNGDLLRDEAVYRVSGPAFFFERELMDAKGCHLEKYADVVDFQFEEYPEETRTVIINWIKENDLLPYIQRQAQALLDIAI
ncbi:MAG TPA: metallophosphoesterase [Parachlamydiaceae bacterium]|nr:metallophosphoesterase [Parachlamydiaceae bacterium]